MTVAPAAPDPLAALMTPAEAAAVLGVAPVTLRTWRTRGTGPAYHRLSPQVVVYARPDVDAWIAENR